MGEQHPIVYQYTFGLGEGRGARTFRLHLRPSDLGLVAPERDSYPAWTALACGRCTCCPLDPASHPRCPIAAQLTELVDFFADSPSYGEVDVEIDSFERRYTRRTTVQKAVSSLLGVYMVTSGCPIMDGLRPMVRFHLPFATVEETTYRVISMYLTAQYLRHRRGLSADWSLAHLVERYESVQQVNRGFLERLRRIEHQDAGANALIILDTFASHLVLALSEDHLDGLEALFGSYLEDRGP
ncbi:MAG: hypothetical protein AB1505_21015 [Candidatus Latescibacterota bacterium]